MSNDLVFIIASLIFVLSVVVFIYGEMKARKVEFSDDDVRANKAKQRSLTRIISLIGVIVTFIILIPVIGGMSGDNLYRNFNPLLILILIPIFMLVNLMRNFLKGVHEE